MNNSRAALNILVTRPNPQGQQLAERLTAAGFTAIAQPLFSYDTNASQAQIKQIINANTNATAIFVSHAAVKFANQTWPIRHWSAACYIGVGQKTAAALTALNLAPVISPAQENSEGLLAMAELSNINQQPIIIVRGDGGRELLGEQLHARGARVSYIESYRRNWLTFDHQAVISQWENQQINCIVITSNALLESIVQLLTPLNNYWQNTCLWIVASERIAESARRFGLKRVINADSANDQTMMAVIVAIAEHGIGS